MKQFFNAQLENSSNKDWTEQVKRYLKELNIHISFDYMKNYVQEIASKSMSGRKLKLNL